METIDERETQKAKEKQTKKTKTERSKENKSYSERVS